jgi:hypothetical protein
MLCNLCNEKDAQEKYRIELQKQNGESNIVYFCSGDCIEQWKNARFCKICSNPRQQESELINNIVICSDDQSKYKEQYPTCKEQYTGKFTCDLCEQEKQLDKTNKGDIAFVIADKSYDTIHYNLCNKCVQKYNLKFIVSKEYIASAHSYYSSLFEHNWFFIKYDNAMYEFVINLFRLKEEQQGIEFICNMCDKYISVREGINIINHKNLCNKCVKIKNKLN